MVPYPLRKHITDDDDDVVAECKLSMEPVLGFIGFAQDRDSLPWWLNNQRQRCFLLSFYAPASCALA